MIQRFLSVKMISLTSIFILALAIPQFSTPAVAEYPDKPIELVIKAGPGSGMS